MVTVNGQFPGPKIVVREGDRVVVKVVNHVRNNITIHWYDHALHSYAYMSRSLGDDAFFHFYLPWFDWADENYEWWDRHGIRQFRNGWADGPAYVTQCPIQTGQSYVYNFRIVGQRGTLWWHAHHSWLRATVYGPLVILPKRGIPYPFPKPHEEEVPILFGT